MTGSIVVNGETRPWRDQTLGELVAEFSLDDRRGGVAVACNSEIVARADWPRVRVRPEDRIEIVHVVRGG